MSNRYRRAFPVDPELAESVEESIRIGTRRSIKDVFPDLKASMDKHDEPTPVCLRCGKKLSSAGSKKLGYGPICFKKHLKEVQKLKERRLF